MLVRLSAVLLIAGCTTQPAAISQQSVAILTFAPESNLEKDGIGPAILQVDGTWLNDRPSSVYIRPGQRSVGIRCPGRIILDTPPPTFFSFQAGAKYEIHCPAQQRPIIRLADD